MSADMFEVNARIQTEFAHCTSFPPFCSLEVIVGLFKLSDIFMELILDAASLSQVVL